MEFLLIVIVIGVLPAAIAHSKGHNFITWWLFGALLFIVALPAAIMVGPSRTCPYCREHVKEQAVICKHCGRKLVEPEHTAEEVDRNQEQAEAEVERLLRRGRP